jgi:hypothetical protein
MLAFVDHDEGPMFFITFGSVCVAAPCAGFWWGERNAESQGGRAALGCLGTIALFIGYFVWLLVLAPLILRWIQLRDA